MRVYLDHNATTPLRAVARDAMTAAMDVAGNPSSVHAEGRAAKGVVERARIQVAALMGCDPQDIVFTSGATEAARMWFAGRDALAMGEIEHDAVLGHLDVCRDAAVLPVNAAGQVGRAGTEHVSALQFANSETGILQTQLCKFPVGFCDATQAAGKMAFDFATSWCDAVCISAHKFGGPKGVGALILNKGIELLPSAKGGGQEMGRRSGTENTVGIAGFGAAAEAAQRDIATGAWERVEKLRNILETALAAASDETIFVGKDAPRLPNTTCVLTPGWKGETQVMQMDLAGFAISAGSACSSGKVKASRVLRAMGYSDLEASSAVRVSLGLETKEDEVLRFAESWGQKRKKHEARAA